MHLSKWYIKIFQEYQKSVIILCEIFLKILLVLLYNVNIDVIMKRALNSNFSAYCMEHMQLSYSSQTFMFHICKIILIFSEKNIRNILKIQNTTFCVEIITSFQSCLYNFCCVPPKTCFFKSK